MLFNNGIKSITTFFLFLSIGINLFANNGFVIRLSDDGKYLKEIKWNGGDFEKHYWSIFILTVRR